MGCAKQETLTVTYIPVPEATRTPTTVTATMTYRPSPVTTTATVTITTIQTVTATPTYALAVTASVEHPSLGGGTQTLYATVTQDEQPAQGAEVSVTVYYLALTMTFAAPPTGADGKTQVSWDVGRPSGGRTVRIEVVATYKGQTTRTMTDFYVP